MEPGTFLTRADDFFGGVRACDAHREEKLSLGKCLHQ